MTKAAPENSGGHEKGGGKVQGPSHRLNHTA
jgi:hypothetical protein